MGHVLKMAMEINRRRRTQNHQTPAEIEQRIYEAMLQFHGVNDLAIGGRRVLYQKLKLVAKAELLDNGLILLIVICKDSKADRLYFKDVTGFEQRLAEEMAEFI